MLLTVCLITLRLLDNSFGQTYSKIISDQDYYTFINDDISKDSSSKVHYILSRQVPLNLNTFYYIDSADFQKKYRSFDIDDLDFIFRYQEDRLGKIIHNGIDSIFKREDIDFFKSQFESMTSIHKWVNPFKNSILIDSIEYEACFQCPFGKRPKYGFVWYSLPLFSKDFKYAICIKQNSFYSAFHIYKRNSYLIWQLVITLNERSID